MLNTEKVIKAISCLLSNCSCTECEYHEADSCVDAVLSDALELLKDKYEPVKPVLTSMTPSVFGGNLIVGSCPVCGQHSLNNLDNKYCGKCGVRLVW